MASDVCCFVSRLSDSLVILMLDFVPYFTYSKLEACFVEEKSQGAKQLVTQYKRSVGYQIESKTRERTLCKLEQVLCKIWKQRRASKCSVLSQSRLTMCMLVTTNY